jgi:general secretion pathway protein C
MRFFKLANFNFIYLIFLWFLFAALAAVGFSKTDALQKNESDFPSISLTGVIVAKNNHSSVAVLKNEEAGKTVIMKVGDSIFGMELTHVFQDGIVLKKEEKIYWLLLEKNLPSKTDMENDFQMNLGVSKNAQVNKNYPEREFDRAEVLQRAEQERSLIIKETKVIPNYLNGKMDGFKVIGLPKIGIASEVGIQKGDVIKEVNGIKLDNLSALLMLYSKISLEQRYEVLIERDQQLIHQVYILK